MKVIYSIKVHRDNLKTLQGLKCLQYVDVGEDGKSLRIKNNLRKTLFESNFFLYFCGIL